MAAMHGITSRSSATLIWKDREIPIEIEEFRNPELARK